MHIQIRLRVLPKDGNDGLEGEPLGDVLPAAEHLAELGAGQLLGVEAALLGLVGGDVALLLGVDEVEAGDGGDAEALGVLLGKVLGVVGPVEVLAGDGGLGTGHVTTDDEVGAAEVLADHYVLDGLAGAGHVHGVGQVLPPGAVVVGLLLEDLVGLVADVAGDVVGLGGAAGGMDEDDAALPDEGIVEGAGEELVVRPVDGVAALEGDDVLVVGEGGPDLLGGLAGEVADGDVEAGDLAAHVVLAALGGDHEGAGMLDGGGAVALEALEGLVGDVLVGELDGGDGAVAVLEEDGLAGLEVLGVGVEDDGQAEEEAGVGQFHVLHDVLVRGLVHEAGQGTEAAVHDELDVAKLAGSQLDLGGALGDGGVDVVGHEVDQLASVGGLLGHLQSGGASSSSAHGTSGGGRLHRHGKGRGGSEEGKGDSELHVCGIWYMMCHKKIRRCI